MRQALMMRVQYYKIGGGKDEIEEDTGLDENDEEVKKGRGGEDEARGMMMKR